MCNDVFSSSHGAVVSAVALLPMTMATRSSVLLPTSVNTRNLHVECTLLWPVTCHALRLSSKSAFWQSMKAILSAVSTSNPMSKTARHWHKEFKKFKRSTPGRQHDARQNYLRTPVTRLEAAARSTTPSATPLPVTGGKHSRPPSSPATSNANGVHNRVTPNKAPHKKTSAGRGVGLADPVRRALDDPPHSPAHIKT